MGSSSKMIVGNSESTNWRMKMVMAGFFPPDPDHIAGGPFYNTYMQVQTLRERNDVELFVVSRVRAEPRREALEAMPDVSFYLLREPRYRLLPRQLTMIPKLSRAMKQAAPDIVVSHSHVETLAALRAGLPTVHMVHGIMKDEKPHIRGIEALKFSLQLRLDTKAIRESKHIICISKYGARACEGMTKARIHLISYPIVEDMFFESPEYSQGKAVLYAGTIYPLKNALTLLKAMRAVIKKHPDSKLRICGRPLDASYMKLLKAYVAENNMEDNVEFLGVISRREIIACLQDSVCLALPSRQENTPNVIAQAMSAARAVVATPVGAVPDMVVNEVTGYLVDPDDVQGMADRICTLIESPDLTRKMGLAGRDIALRAFERHAHIEQLMTICREVIADYTHAR